MTTNLPMIFPLIKNWLKPWFGTALRSSKPTYNYKSPSGFQTIGGGHSGNALSRDRRGASNANSHVVSGNMSFNNSEERMVDDVKMQNIMVTASPGGDQPAKGIMVSNQVEVTREDRSQTSDQAQRAHEPW